VEVRQQGGRVGVAIVRRPGEQVTDDARERRRDSGPGELDDATRRIRVGARPPVEALEQDAAERVEVGPSVHAIGCEELLRRRVAPRAHGVARGERSDGRYEAEVDEARLVARIEQYVARLDVAVDQACLVHRAKRVRELTSQVEHLVDRQRTEKEARCQALALHELHEQVGQPVGFADLDDARQAGMAHSRQSHRLAIDPARPLALNPRQLQRAARVPLARAVDDGVRPVPQLFADLQSGYAGGDLHGRVSE